jgi:hypothetical protein
MSRILALEASQNVSCPCSGGDWQGGITDGRDADTGSTKAPEASERSAAARPRGLKGCVLRLFARSQVVKAGDIDDITVSHLSLDGNRAAQMLRTARRGTGAAGTNLCTVMPAALPFQIQTSATNTVSCTFSSPNDAYLVALWTDGIAAEYDPGITATLTLPGLLDHQVTGIDTLHGFEQPLMASEEDGDLVIRDLLVKDFPILLRVSPIRRIFMPAVLKAQGS